MLDHGLWTSECDYVRHCKPDRPRMFFRADVLQATATRFLRGFPGIVSYAVKANAAPQTLASLVQAGIHVFDVASPQEMHLARAADPQAVLHYNNPVRSRAEIAEAVRFGVTSASVDSLAELEKLCALPRETEIAVRFALPVAGAAYDFGEKFGATPDVAIALLQKVKKLGFQPALTFHPGTQCNTPEPWAQYIEAAAQICQRAGVAIARLNVGGGFAANRSGQEPDLARVFYTIEKAVQRCFENPPVLVCEPGRAMVAEAFTLCTNVKAIREDGAIFLNDGLYGGLAELRDMPDFTRVRVLTATGDLRSDTSMKRVVFGPSCDSLDRLPEPMALPREISEGDYVMFDGMGAYSLALSTQFNGYGVKDLVALSPKMEAHHSTEF